MTKIDRRAFLRHSAAAAGVGAALGGPMQALIARGAMAKSGDLAASATNGGYGPLVPIPDETDGVVRLHLPEGFAYRSFALTGEVMSDGRLTPGRHDGMAAFSSRPGRIRLVRNHEVNNPGPTIGDPSRSYDTMAQGGTSTLEVNKTASQVTSWVSSSGTQMNCAGGGMPWGSWITAEETINGPDVGPDFTGVPNDPLTQQHGYIFEIPSSWGPNQYQAPVPIRSAGRFAHEAVDLDETTGIPYMTEDNFNFPSGLYRYIAPTNPLSAKRVTDGGVLEMLAVSGEPNAELHTGRTVGSSYPVEWVVIDEPDKTFPEGTTNDQALVFVGDQGRAKGAANFSRLEGIFASNGKIYVISTQGGDTPGDPGGGYGDGFGQVWMYDTVASTLTLIFESPSQEVLDLPDNLTVSPKGSLLLCEDGAVNNYLRGITPAGELFDFGLNAIAGREREEFAGATFAPGGKSLFVNIQAASAYTFAIWGPFARGAL